MKVNLLESTRLLQHGLIRYVYAFFFIITQEFTGNTDRNTIVRYNLNPPITARFIRFRPVSWTGHISMRAELYGCFSSKIIAF